MRKRDGEEVVAGDTGGDERVEGRLEGGARGEHVVEDDVGPGAAPRARGGGGGGAPSVRSASFGGGRKAPFIFALRASRASDICVGVSRTRARSVVSSLT